MLLLIDSFILRKVQVYIAALKKNSQMLSKKQAVVWKVFVSVSSGKLLNRTFDEEVKHCG